MPSQLPPDWQWDREIHDFDTLRRNVLRLRERRPGGLPTLSLLGDLDACRDKWPRDVLEDQRPDGWFERAISRFTLHRHSLSPLVETLIRQRDLLAECIHLKTPPRYPLRFAHPLVASPRAMEHWLETQPWNNPWAVGNADMDTAWCLAFEWKVMGNPAAGDALNVWLEWHDRHLDPATGFWDLARTGNLRHCMAGAMHQYAIYFLFDRPIRYPEQIVDATLSLQEETGLFADEWYSNNCLDIDAVFLLTNLYHKYGVRENEIRCALQRAFEASFKCFVPEGGAVSRAGVDREADWWSTWCRVTILGWSARILGIREFLGPWDFRPRHPFQSENGGLGLPDWQSDAWYDAVDWPRPQVKGGEDK